MESAAGATVMFEKSSRMRRVAILGASALAAWLFLGFLRPDTHAFSSDQNTYLAGAAALKAGHGYRFEPYIGLPRIGIYPPGFSIWLALFWKAGEPFAVNLHRLEVANWIAAGGALFALAACLLISELPVWMSAAIVALLGTSVLFTQLTAALMSDVLFTAANGVLALLVAAYNPNRKLSAWWFAVGILTGALYLLKTVALAYIVGLAAFGFLNGNLRRFSRFVYFALPTCSAIILWFLFTRGIPTYATQFNERLLRIGGLEYCLHVIKLAAQYCSGRWLVTVLLSVPDQLNAARSLSQISFLMAILEFLLGLAFAVPIFLGIRRGAKRPSEQINLFLLGAVAVVFVFWPFTLGARGVMAIVPFLTTWLWRGLTLKLAQAAFMVLLAVNIPGNIWLSYKYARYRETESVKTLAALQEAASWIQQTGGAGATVAAGPDVPLIHLYEYLGRRVLAHAIPNGKDRFADVSPAAQGNLWADYLITDSSLDRTPLDPKQFHVHRIFGKWAVASPRR